MDILNNQLLYFHCWSSHFGSFGHFGHRLWFLIHCTADQVLVGLYSYRMRL